MGSVGGLVWYKDESQGAQDANKYIFMFVLLIFNNQYNLTLNTQI